MKRILLSVMVVVLAQCSSGVGGTDGADAAQALDGAAESPDGGLGPVDGGGPPTTRDAGGSDSGASPVDGGAGVCGAEGQICCAGGSCTAGSCRGGTCQRAQVGETGKSCAKNSDCATGICLPVGGKNVCTTPCSGVGDCVPGWRCGPLLGQPASICQCALGAEACNGRDDSCDGVVDEQPAGCGANKQCQGGACTCVGSLSACGTGCVDLAADRANCGSCGKVCASDHTCVASSCACPGRTECGGSCVDTDTDARSCGACGASCPGGASCRSGKCVCPGGTVVCSDACVDTATSPSNCNGCGLSCTAGSTCVASVCTCNPGLSPCAGKCVDLKSDPLNCNGCGAPCMLANATARCSAGICTVGSCDTSFGDCSAAAAGCETDLRTSITSCGSCQYPCQTYPRSTPRCLFPNGRCGITCDSGYGDCNLSIFDGCEIDTRVSVAHCGACGGLCPAQSGATVSCAAGKCQYTCSYGYADCGTGPLVCETQLLTDNANCGACGNACTLGETCLRGTCAEVIVSGWSAIPIVPMFLAVDDSYLYWSERTEVRYAAKAGAQTSSGVRDTAPARYQFGGLAADSAGVVWALHAIYNGDHGTLFSSPTPTAVIKQLTTATTVLIPYSLALDGARVVYADVVNRPPLNQGYAVFTLNRAGGTPTRFLVESGIVWGVGAAGGALAWPASDPTGPGKIRLVPPGGAVTDLDTFAQSGGSGSATADSTHAWWVTSGIKRRLFAAGSPVETVLPFVTGTRLMVDARYLYWTEGANLVRAVKASTVTPTPFIRNLGASAGAGIFAQDATYWYWYANEPPTSIPTILRKRK